MVLAVLNEAQKDGMGFHVFLYNFYITCWVVVRERSFNGIFFNILLLPWFIVLAAKI